MEINYKFIPAFETAEEKHKKDIISYAGKLMELAQMRTMVIYLDEDDKPVVLETEGRLINSDDFVLGCY